MSVQVIRGFFATAFVLVPLLAAGQHEGHQVPGQTVGGAPVDPAQLSACVAAQRQTSALVDAANARLENARQTNAPSAMRSAMEDLQTTLSTIRTQLASCTELQAAVATAAGGGHDMATMPRDAPGGLSAPNFSAAPPKAVPGTAVIQGTSRPATAGRAASSPAATAAPPKMVMVMTATDPAKLRCDTKVDSKTAAKTTYKGTTYYFCSAKDRAEFLGDPAMSLAMRPPL